ncbi:ABC-2 type transport system permease protein [Archangium gephyra]|uniref:Transport permease protein n=2 Tax=Archangium gephyra TaxID=48 RepID=A0ABX9K5G0_9BACT|nr:ABC transporter permease [Archangium gephyra]REG33401.1 ABC-2 type transport system permease protein [Archangium gephyra]
MNTIGMKSLLVKEVRRFMRVPGQTVLSPLISTSLYFLVFGYSLSGRVHEVEGVPYLQFIVPGLVFMGLANNAFLNSSSSLFITKIQGTVVDLLVAPLGPLELMAGFIGGAMVRGLLVGGLTWAVATLFTGFRLEHAPAALLFLLLSSYTFSVLGILAAVWAEKFEQINFFPTFVMLPLTFLGGIFYSVRQLPSPWNHVSLFNPMVYMVEGLRYGMLGQSGFSPLLGASILVAVALVATGVAWAALRSGYKLKA